MVPLPMDYPQVPTQGDESTSFSVEVSSTPKWNNIFELVNGLHDVSIFFFPP